MSENFNLEIISPEKILLKDQTTSVTIPSFEGDMMILKDHISLIAILRPGIIKIFGSKKAEYFVEEGAVEFSNNNLIILSSTILDVKELSRDQISKMIDDCKNQLNNKSGLDDKTNYVISHKIDVLSRINL
jgi:ATP synthase F1 epsilon subunit